MGFEQLVGILVPVTLFEMMLATGLSVRPADLVQAVKSKRLVIGAGLANYVAVPIAAALLLIALDIDTLVAAGILILAVCPGAPYAPPLAALARGTTATSVGLMVVLAGSSVVVVPLLLPGLLAITTGKADLHVEPLMLLGAIAVTQLHPLCGGLALNYWRPDLAARLLGPAVTLSKILNAATLSLIIASQLPQLLNVRLEELFGMLILLSIGLGIGWSVGGSKEQDRRAIALTTSIRNVGLGLEISTALFPNTAAVTAIVVYGLLQLLGSFALALMWRRGPSLAAVHGDKRASLQ